MLFQPRIKVLEADGERVRSRPAERGRKLAVELYTPELSNIVIEERAVVKFQNRTRVFAGAGVPEQVSGHTEMNVERAAVEFDKYLLALASNRTNGRARQ